MVMGLRFAVMGLRTTVMRLRFAVMGLRSNFVITYTSTRYEGTRIAIELYRIL